MYLKVLSVLALFTGSAWSMTAVHQGCVATFDEDLHNDLFLGTWYRVVKLFFSGNTIPSEDCVIYTYTAPNATELRRYQDRYMTSDAPFSFNDDPLFEDPRSFHHEGLLLGKKQAKFFIWNPSSAFRTPEYDVRVYQRINDNYILMHDCNLRGNIRWLLSRTKNPSAAELEEALEGQTDIARMQRQLHCV